MKKILLIAGIGLLACASAESGRAQAVAMATLTNNGVPIVNITSNQSFTLTLMINTNFVSSGFTLFLQSNAAGSGLFTITGIDRTGSPYPDPPPLPAPCGNACVLNPMDDIDLGATGDQFTNVPPGMYTMATISFSTLEAPLGQYTISTS